MTPHELTDVLLSHCGRYPGMLIQDMVKLIYQNEFGAGHFISSEAKSLARLREEWNAVNADDSSTACEDLGNGLCRMHLCGVKDSLTPETVNRFFVLTANQDRASIPGFEDKLAVLRQLCASGQLPFAVTELDAYVSAYSAQGYPPVSHSARYRENYAPSYRVVRRVFCHYLALFARIENLLSTGRRTVVAIDGRCAAGKSTLASLLAGVYNCNTFHMDDFFLPEAQKTDARLAQAGGNVDYERFATEVLLPLSAAAEFSFRAFDCMDQRLKEPIPVQPKQLSIIEGAYSLHPSLRSGYDLKVFLDIDPQLQSQRLHERNGPRMYERFVTEWIPLENRYFAELDIAAHCDLAFSAN